MSQNATTKPVYARVASKPWNLLNAIIVSVSGLFGEKSKEVERFLKFGVVGTIGAFVDFGTLLILQATILVPLQPHKELKVVTATSIAFVAAITSNFIWNRFWTYPDSRTRSMRRQIAQFTFINAIGWVLRTVWIRYTFLPIGIAITPMFITIMARFSPEYVPSPETAPKLGTLAAQFIAIFMVMFWNFFANRYWTYNDVD